MLKERMITAFGLLILTYVLFFHASHVVFTDIIMMVFGVAMYEMLKMYKVPFLYIIQSIVIFFISTYCVVFKYPESLSTFIMYIVVIIWFIVVPILLFTQIKKIPIALLCIFAIILFTTSVYSIIILRNTLGIWELLSIMSIAWVSDSGAYFIGRKFGKHKLASKISPGKTIEGAIAGFVLVLIYLLILKYFNLINYINNYSSVFKFAVTLTSIGIIGDLFESWLKRNAGVKDSGSLLPGHGGVFDRIDSLIAVVSIAYAMIIAASLYAY